MLLKIPLWSVSSNIIVAVIIWSPSHQVIAVESSEVVLSLARKFMGLQAMRKVNRWRNFQKDDVPCLKMRDAPPIYGHWNGEIDDKIIGWCSTITL